jgi:hypothetical protein
VTGRECHLGLLCRSPGPFALEDVVYSPVCCLAWDLLFGRGCCTLLRALAARHCLRFPPLQGPRICSGGSVTTPIYIDFISRTNAEYTVGW